MIIVLCILACGLLIWYFVVLAKETKANSVRLKRNSDNLERIANALDDNEE